MWMSGHFIIDVKYMYLGMLSNGWFIHVVEYVILGGFIDVDECLYFIIEVMRMFVGLSNGWFIHVDELGFIIEVKVYIFHAYLIPQAFLF